MALRITLNGTGKEFSQPEPRTLQELVAALDLNPAQVAIEQNGAIVRRAAWSRAPLADGDKLEVVQFVGGGCPVSSQRSFSQLLP